MSGGHAALEVPQIMQVLQSLGVIGFLEKPFSRRALLDAVQNALTSSSVNLSC